MRSLALKLFFLKEKSLMNILHQYPCSKHISSKFCTFSKHQYGFIMQMTKMTGSFTEWQKPPPCLYTLPFKEQKLQQQLKKGPSLVRSIFNFFTQLLYTVSVANTHTHPRATPSLNSSGAILSNVLPSLTEWAHSSEWGVEQAVLKRELLKELSKTKWVYR